MKATPYESNLRCRVSGRGGDTGETKSGARRPNRLLSLIAALFPSQGHDGRTSKQADVFEITRTWNRRLRRRDFRTRLGDHGVKMLKRLFHRQVIHFAAQAFAPLQTGFQKMASNL